MENLAPHTRAESKQIGVKTAQELMNARGGPRIGETVSHPSDGNIYIFVNRMGRDGIVSIPAESSATGVKIIEKFPIDELYNPKEALQIIEQDQLRSRRIIQLN